MNSFICDNCHKEVITNGNIGTHQRNHCPFCLYSKHVDTVPGDRKADCHGLMKPIGLSFKQEGQGKIGELILIHQCANCKKISINRLAGDDDITAIQQTFENSMRLKKEIKERLDREDVYLANEKDRQEIQMQLFGR